MQDVTKPGLTGPEWDAMTVAERVARCHAYAREAMQLAGAAHPDVQPIYKKIASQWNTLAAEMEQAVGDRS